MGNIPAAASPQPLVSSAQSLRRHIPGNPAWVLLPVMMMVAVSLLPEIRDRSRVSHSCWAVAAAVTVVAALLQFRLRRARRAVLCEVAMRKAHYVQAAMHSCIYLYWGVYWREVYRYGPLILVQLAFAYALDMLLCWWRRDKWVCGFGPFPIVLSINLFLWFTDGWFWAQFAVIAVAVLGKEFVTWERVGRRTHIFNPSAFALFVVSALLILTQSTALIRAGEIAFTFAYPPGMYVAILLVGLVVQALFSVTLVTLSSRRGPICYQCPICAERRRSAVSRFGHPASPLSGSASADHGSRNVTEDERRENRLRSIVRSGNRRKSCLTGIGWYFPRLR